MSILHILIVAIITILIMGVVIAVMVSQEKKRKARMMSVIRGGAHKSAGKALKNDKDRKRADMAKKLKDSKVGTGKGGKKKVSIALKIEQAGLSTSVRKFWILSFISMFAVLALANFMHQPPHILILAAIIGLLGLPRFVLKKLAARRQKKFLEEFPDALEATVRLLKAGMPVSEAISMIAREYDGPVGEEMGRIYDKQKIGVSLAEAALESTKRMPLTEMQMFATGLSIQAQTGSSLSEVLMNLSGVIRSRFRLKRKIKALSSEAVASASIIGALPIIVAGGMYFVNYEYLEVLFITPTGNMLLTVAIGMMAFGIFIMKQMINFKV